ncbi:MAG TPA: M4 family metallopeptidase, partial [Bacteroidia bacterium]
MRKHVRLCLSIATALSGISFSASAQSQLSDAAITSYSKLTGLPNFFRFYPGHRLNAEQLNDWARYSLGLDGAVTFKAYSTEPDQLGFVHVRFREYLNEYPIENSMLIAHVKDGNVVSLNGDYYKLLDPAQSAAVSEQLALQNALKKVNAKRYKWENRTEEEEMKKDLNDPGFTYYPKGELVIAHVDGKDYSAANMRLAYKFNIYAEEPLSRAYIFVDAQTGEVIGKSDIIHDADVVGTATTVYSGTVPMTCDNTGPNAYRLQETGRGNGIRTYNINNTTTYTNTDFTNNSPNWNLANPNKAAEDAHWGAEMTYDYYNQVHSRNSIDGNGYALLSYVHYSTNYVNAFWDGTRMTYGDGNISQGFSIMTGLDVCGHEITHGLTTFTAGLNGGEAGALNEGFSDIFGTTIERFARPSQWDWIMGADITTNGLGIRTMSNPNSSAYPGPQPDTYMGTYWDPNGEVHNNNGPCIYWYYLLCQGGSGTNDNNNAYNVTGITMNSARRIAFRGL